MAASADEYIFKPHERPLMPGSPATPDHPFPRRIAYALIGVLISLTSGLSNGLLIANLPQIQGSLGLTPDEGGWLTAAYSMTNVCTSFVLIRCRQQFGLQRITRIFLLGFVIVNGLLVIVESYGLEIAARAASGVVASGFTPLGFFYIMQAMPPKARMSGMVIGLGLTQVALPLARAISPLLLVDGEVQNLYIFEFGLSLLCLGCVAILRLPPSERIQVFEKLDFLTFALFAPGVMMLAAVLVQGRIVWWSTPWLGWATAGAIILIGLAMLIEHNRANPMLNTRWIASRDVLRFAMIAASMRILLGEQNYGSIGLLTAVGMGPDQLVSFYGVVTAATLAGLIVGVWTLNPLDLLRQIVISAALICIAALMDTDTTNLTRPANLYLTQSMIAFAAIYFLGPTMMGGILRALARGPSHMVSYSAVFSLSQTLGGLAGSALLGSFQIIREKFHSHELVQSLVMTDPQIVLRTQQLSGAYGRVLGDPALLQAEGGSLLAQQVTREANILAFNDVFLLIAILAGMTFLWLGGRWLYFRIKGVNPLGPELEALQRMLANR
ncbi:MFS transporter [Sphingobium sp. SCG-1]|uniref:MFS transporter n=1 Tax=Sphingobium sp. SCG-1 TaxID=2072936 RepID=UPI000CD6B1F9|nr:MFS transporter [Sphingobium sp. SCG-1]AUW57719.1 MFS transporter [Sphingobium sp. SCG-1]